MQYGRGNAERFDGAIGGAVVEDRAGEKFDLCVCDEEVMSLRAFVAKQSPYADGGLLRRKSAVSQ